MPGNSADYGDGIYNAGTLTVNTSVFANNSPYNISGPYSSGIDVVSGSKVLLYDTLIAANLAGGNPADIQGNLPTHLRRDPGNGRQPIADSHGYGDEQP